MNNVQQSEDIKNMGNKASLRGLGDLTNGMEVERPVKSSQGSNSTATMTSSILSKSTLAILVYCYSV